MTGTCTCAMAAPGLGGEVHAERFGRAIVMPNLKPAITSPALAAAYRERILAALPAGSSFEPLMTLYLTDSLPPQEIDKAKASGLVHGVKLYPAGATTHSDAGVTDIRHTYATLDRMQEVGMPLQVHGETPARMWTCSTARPISSTPCCCRCSSVFPRCGWCSNTSPRRAPPSSCARARNGVGATITPQHLLHNRNALFTGGIRPHYYCCRF